jgi:hypothetical protein
VPRNKPASLPRPTSILQTRGTPGPEPDRTGRVRNQEPLFRDRVSGCVHNLPARSERHPRLLVRPVVRAPLAHDNASHSSGVIPGHWPTAVRCRLSDCGTGRLAAGSSSNRPPQLRVYGGGNVPINSCSDGATPFCTHITREYSIFAVHDQTKALPKAPSPPARPELGGVRTAGSLVAQLPTGQSGFAAVIRKLSTVAETSCPCQVDVFALRSTPTKTLSLNGFSPIFIQRPL